MEDHVRVIKARVMRPHETPCYIWHMGNGQIENLQASLHIPTRRYS